MFDSTLDDELQAVICQPVGSTDEPYGPDSIAWVTAAGKPEEFCRRFQAMKEGKSQVQLSEVWNIGGFLAHLEITKYSSGLVAGIVHKEDHGLVAYFGSIFECEGMQGETPQIHYPDKLTGLSVGDFALFIQPYVTENDGQRTFSCVTRGESSVDLPGGEGLAKATLTYYIARRILPDLSGEYSPFFLLAELNLDKGDKCLSIELDAVNSTCTLKHSAGQISHVFSFGRDGRFYDAQAVVPHEGAISFERSSWNSAFGACFGFNAPPAIDLETTLLKIIHPFTGHQLLPHEDVPQDASLGTFIGSRQPEFAYRFLLPAANL